ncbi:alpha/beta hydrolase [Demequina sp.]|uniref:alpha/beta hydrolase n=1 Tax=Demequina sp. TaxID=2050685 RepID=UPI003D0F60C6
MTTLAFIHGMYMTAASWESWRELATTAGFETIAVEWPGHEGDPKAMRANPPGELRTLGFPDLVGHHAKELEDHKDAILIGHSVGGLLVQALLAQGVGKAGVAISPAPPSGMISLRPEFLRANLPHTNALLRSKPLPMSSARFARTFGNATAPEARDAIWEQFVTPEARGVPLDTLFGRAKVDPAHLTAPLAIYGGTKDRLIPVSLARKIAARYPQAEFTALEGRDHLLCNSPGWDPLADAVLAWAAAVE